MTVKTTAQTLQRFGAELAETELPNDIPSTKELLLAHSQEHRQLQVGPPGWERPQVRQAKASTVVSPVSTGGAEAGADAGSHPLPLRQGAGGQVGAAPAQS